VDFVAVLDQVITLLRQRGRLTYGTLKRQFSLDDAALDDLKDELIYGQRVAVDEDGRVLVWTGAEGAAPPATAAPVSRQDQLPLPSIPAYLAEKILFSKSALEGERKQVTVLFADLKGSMELLADRDPEEARQLLDPVLEHMMAAVHRYEGTVNQVMGDGIMALFGAPVAHEDHAVRACYAALAMQHAVGRYAEEVRRQQGLDVLIRVGLHSGEVVVRAIGNDLHMDYTAVGQTTHLAARMEQLARPGTILFTADTLRLVEGLVHLTPLGPIPVKGLPEPVEVYELVGASTLRGRFQAGVGRGLTRFVGRDQELATVQHALAQAGAGHGQVVALVGEAGVGKSRLVYEVIHAHQTQGWRVLESTSVSYGKATPYFPVIELLKRYVQVEDSDDARTIRAKVTGQVLTLDESLQDTLPALLALLDVLPDDSPFRQFDPAQRRQRMLTALKRVLLRESQEQPLLLVFEDLHWIDSETQALLDSLVESLPTARLVLLVNYRPEYQHGWGSKTSYAQLRLDPLPPASADALLHALLGDDPSLTPLTQLLIARTAGNPFFLEESVRTLVETGVLVGEPGAYQRAQALPTIQVPGTVQAVLAARIDRLPPEEKRLLQTAAVIGTEVPLPLLQAIAEVPEDALQRELTHLQAAEFLYETRLFPERVCTFKHALTHEVAYGGLLQERRRVLHASIMEASKTLYGDRLSDQVERLAYHAVRGERWEQALCYCRQAGARALAHSANQEAVTYFEGALTALQHLPDSPERRTRAIDLRFDLRLALLRLGLYARILPLLEEAIALAEANHDQARLGRAYRSMIEQFLNMDDPARALDAGQRALALATRLDDVALQISTRATLARVYGNYGDYRQAVDICRHVVAALTDDVLPQLAETMGPGATRTRAYAAWNLAELGAFAEGLVYGSEALQFAQATPDIFGLVIALWSTGYLYLLRGDLPHAMPLLAQSLDVCQTNQMDRFLPRVMAYLGYAYALAGRLPEALPLLEQAQALLEEARATGRGSLTQQARIVTLMSEAYRLAGRLDEARQGADRALNLARTHQERGSEAWSLWLLGDLTAQESAIQGEVAVSYYAQALVLAEELGMRPLQAHCHRGLGTLYTATSQREQARTELSTAITLYRDMDMSFWLPQAEAALAQGEG
jgi:class 3 adenylate cyclase/tetratricopeptide (TPR) repeat protein